VAPGLVKVQQVVTRRLLHVLLVPL
jgi:hypothetical protein